MYLQNPKKTARFCTATCCALITFCLLSSCPVATAQSDNTSHAWSHWRGPHGNGISDSTGTPTNWSKTENIRWQTTLPGSSSATPTLSGNLILTSSNLDQEYQLGAYSTKDGRLVWKRTITAIRYKTKREARKYSAPSLVSDENCVVVTTDHGDCSCYQLSGEPLWKLDLSEQLSPLHLDTSYSSAPFLHEGNLYVQWIHGDGNPLTHESMIACIDAQTGSTIWTTARTTGARQACEQSYASPILVNAGNQAVIVSHGADYAVAHRLIDGQEVWRIGGLNPMSNYRSSSPFVASPIASEGILILPAAKNGVVLGLDLTGQLDSEESSINRSRMGLIGWGPQQWRNLSGKPKRLWRLSGGAPGTASPLLHEGLLYLCSEAGELSCYDALTSEIFYREWLPKGYYHASPVLSDGKIYFTSYAGEVTVLSAGKEFRMLAINELPGPIVSSPIIDRGVIYLRSYKKLYAIESNESNPDANLSAAVQ